MFTMQSTPIYNWETEKKPVSSLERPILSTKQILIVGQHESSLQRMKYLLGSMYGLTIKKSVSEGMSALNFSHFDLIITEYASGGIDGKALLQSIKAKSHTRVIILSINQNEKEIMSLYDHKADEVIRMPFRESEFMQRVRQLLPDDRK